MTSASGRQGAGIAGALEIARNVAHHGIELGQRDAEPVVIAAV